MAGHTLTRFDLAAAVHRRVGLSHNESARLVEAVLGEIVGGLLREGEVKLSSFGTFRVSERGARVGRNPRTGVEARVPAHRSLVFRPSGVLRLRVGRGVGTKGDRP